MSQLLNLKSLWKIGGGAGEALELTHGSPANSIAVLPSIKINQKKLKIVPKREDLCCALSNLNFRAGGKYLQFVIVLKS